MRTPVHIGRRVVPLALCCALLAGCRVGEPPKKTVPEEKDPLKEQFDKNSRRLTLADFDRFTDPKAGKPAEPTWTEKEGVIRCTGRPRGYLYTKTSHRNFELHFEFKFDKPKDPKKWPQLNTGCLVYGQGDHKLWPACLEVQGKYLEMAEIKSNVRGVKVETDAEKQVRDEAREEPGRWNRVVVRSREGALLVILNGRTIASSRPTRLKEGWVGFQSEGSPVEFRNVRILDIDMAGPPAP